MAFFIRKTQISKTLPELPARQAGECTEICKLNELSHDRRE